MASLSKKEMKKVVDWFIKCELKQEVSNGTTTATKQDKELAKRNQTRNQFN
jgi:hypothetical protein